MCGGPSSGSAGRQAWLGRFWRAVSRAPAAGWGRDKSARHERQGEGGLDGGKEFAVLIGCRLVQRCRVLIKGSGELRIHFALRL
jgi:hypothetical protein